MVGQNHTNVDMDFWKEIHQVNNCKIPLHNSNEDVTGIDEITELWRSHFKQLFNCIRGRLMYLCLKGSH